MLGLKERSHLIKRVHKDAYAQARPHCMLQPMTFNPFMQGELRQERLLRRLRLRGQYDDCRVALKASGVILRQCPFPTAETDSQPHGRILTGPQGNGAWRGYPHERLTHQQGP